MRAFDLVAVISVTVGAACTQQVPAEEFAAQFAHAVCARNARCQGLAPYLEQQCTTSEGLQIAAGDIPAALAKGRVHYDAVLARRCIDLVGSTPCLADLPISSEAALACYSAVRGTVAPGEACHSFFECAQGICVAPSGGSCPGVCPTVAEEGEPCSISGALPCDERQGLLCSANLCTRPGPLGAACEDDFGCQSGTVCFAGVCSRLRNEGEGCTSDQACHDGFACIGGSDEGGGKCERRKTEGEACAVDPDDIDPALRGAQCADGLVCKGAGLTLQGQVLPGVCTAAAGERGDCQTEAAGMQIQVTGCQAGLVCVGGSCVLPPESGPCAAHDTCKRDTTYCAQDSKTCLVLRPDGEACAAPYECTHGACLNGVCGAEPLFCRAN